MPHAPGLAHSFISMQRSSPSPSKPALHLHTKCAGKLQHSAFSTHLAAILGSWHSSISMNIWRIMINDIMIQVQSKCCWVQRNGTRKCWGLRSSFFCGIKCFMVNIWLAWTHQFKYPYDDYLGSGSHRPDSPENRNTWSSPTCSYNVQKHHTDDICTRSRLWEKHTHKQIMLFI